MVAGVRFITRDQKYAEIIRERRTARNNVGESMMPHIKSDSRVEGGADFRIEDNGEKTPLGMMSMQTEAIMKRQQEDKPFDIGVFNDGVKGDSGELAGMPSEETFTESDFNVALRFPSAIRTMWSDEIAVEVFEALLLNKPFELLNQKLQQKKGEQNAR